MVSTVGAGSTFWFDLPAAAPVTMAQSDRSSADGEHTIRPIFDRSANACDEDGSLPIDVANFRRGAHWSPAQRRQAAAGSGGEEALRATVRRSGPEAVSIGYAVMDEMLRHSGGELPWDDAAVLVVGIR